MAPKQLLLEGPAIEPLLEKVWAEHGTDVTIVKAERVRVGGVAGFFAREQFEVTVEIPDPVEPAATGPTGSPSSRPAPARPAPAARPAARQAPAAAPRPATPAAAQPQGLEALLAAAEQQDDRPLRPASRPSARTAPAPAPAPAAAAPGDFDAIFGAVTGAPSPSPVGPAGRAARPAPRFPARPAADSEDDDPWVDGPPAAARPSPAPDRAQDHAQDRAQDDGHDADAAPTLLPETPLMSRGRDIDAEDDDSAGPFAWRAPWETTAGMDRLTAEALAAHARAGGPATPPSALAAELAAELAARADALAADADTLDDAVTDQADAPDPALGSRSERDDDPGYDDLVSHLGPHRAAYAEQPGGPGDAEHSAHTAAAPLGSGLAVLGVPDVPPRRVGRSFAPVPGAQPATPSYALERSAVLRLPETAPSAAYGPANPHGPVPPLLAPGGSGTPHVVTSLGAATAPAASPLLAPEAHPTTSWGDEHPGHPDQAGNRSDGSRRARRGSWAAEPPGGPGYPPHPGEPSPSSAGYHDLSAPLPGHLSDQVPDHRLPDRLAALGVPAAWLWDLPLDRSAALRELSLRLAAAAAAPAVRRRPAVPVADPVVVVLADLEDALPVAQHLATGMGLDAEGVVVMGRRAPGVPPEQCLPSRQAVQDAASAARAQHRPLVVVLPAPIGAAPPVRAALTDTLDHLGPDEVWAVVDATRRLEDTAAWLAAVAGDRGVDALALTNSEVTSAPAAALALPAPVVLVGDRPATPEAWVSMLAARLAEQDLR